MSREFSCKYDLFWVSGSQVKKKSITSPKFLHFYQYLSFEEDLALYLNNLESPLPKDDFYQV
jgi:hypothetical protein